MSSYWPSFHNDLLTALSHCDLNENIIPAVTFYVTFVTAGS